VAQPDLSDPHGRTVSGVAIRVAPSGAAGRCCVERSAVAPVNNHHIADTSAAAS
jgi:hypothetical protein